LLPFLNHIFLQDESNFNGEYKEKKEEMIRR